MQRATELADEPFAVHVHNLAHQGGTMAVHAAEAAGAECSDAVTEERDLHKGVPVAGQREHGLRWIRYGHRETSIDPVPKIGSGPHG